MFYPPRPSNLNSVTQTEGSAKCQKCQHLPLNKSCKEFKDAHGFTSDWQSQEESDKERYRIPENMNLDHYRGFIGAVRHIYMRASPAYLSVMSPHERCVLLRNRGDIEEYARLLEMSRHLQRGQFLDDKTESSYVTERVQTWVGPDLKGLQVCGAAFVRGGRWYLGHVPGTYIFKFRGYQRIRRGMDACLSPVVIFTEDDFEYMGQVPRHERVHTLRLRQLFGSLLRLFISELQVHAGFRHGSKYPDHEELLSCENVESALVFKNIWDCWRSAHLEDPKWPDAKTQDDFISHPKILETAWLLDWLAHLRSGKDQPQQPLEMLLVGATNKEIPKLAELWHERQKATALRMLASGKREGLFIYEVDIHHFYNQAPFDSDIWNPAVFNSFPDLERPLVPAAERKAALTENRSSDRFVTMASIFSLRGLFSRQTAPATPTTRLFSTTANMLARTPPKPAAKKPAATTPRRKHVQAKSENFYRIRTLRQNMFSPAPPPLRMARLRYLRHWTIHRAWQLFRRQQHLATEQERHRIYSGMYNACEELRKTVGPGNRDEGYLYRVAMEKKGVWGTDAIPIEYARYQTDFPAKNAWNHDWKRHSD
ncbi:ring finger [Fusarium longipes]|uniref:Ring finger n=1 Tax=Fusarium longipes TaxID=694270 RepID=A0A395SES1_9HYPO|nr:ring finger [Fusarium longipes]